MANITYLLGAGASANALPIVNEIPSAVEDVIIELSQWGYIPSSNINYTRESFDGQLKFAISNLKKLRDGCNNHLSIDTYAKMLYLTESSDYGQTKATIGLFFRLHNFFNYEKHIVFNNSAQKKNCRSTAYLDKRYDSFFASILEDKYDSFPDNIKILSWNYDTQFEETYKRYISNAKSNKLVTDILNIHNRSQNKIDFDYAKFAIYKLNGSTEYRGDDQNGEFLLDIDPTLPRSEQLFFILHYYKNALQQHPLIQPFISFAWDNKTETEKLIGTIKAATKDTHYLVTIGYSFPFFNRKIDREIITNMKKLERIYIQDKKPEEIKDRIKAIRTEYQNPLQSGRLVSVNDIDQFYFPHEL